MSMGQSPDIARAEEVTDDQYKLYSVTCLLIAAKSFERDEIIPRSA